MPNGSDIAYDVTYTVEGSGQWWEKKLFLKWQQNLKFESVLFVKFQGIRSQRGDQKVWLHYALLNKTAFMALLIIILRTQQFVTSNLPVSSGAWRGLRARENRGFHSFSGSRSHWQGLGCLCVCVRARVSVHPLQMKQSSCLHLLPHLKWSATTNVYLHYRLICILFSQFTDS